MDIVTGVSALQRAAMTAMSWQARATMDQAGQAVNKAQASDGQVTSRRVWVPSLRVQVLAKKDEGREYECDEGRSSVGCA